MQAQSTRPADYRVGTDTDDEIIRRALEILEARVARGDAMDSPKIVRSWLAVRSAGLDREVFSVMFLDAQHRLVAFEEMFRGTLNQTSVYPREVVRRALAHNAAAVVLHHNHPSGVAQPSKADEVLTKTLKSALALVDCRVLDHFVTGGAECVSMAELGLV